MILSLQTTTFSAFGGIPTYNRLICRVLNEIGAPRQTNILIATDKLSDLEDPRAELTNLQLEGFAQKRPALIQRIIHLALTRQIDLALIGHVNYAPLALILKQFQPRLRYGVILYGIEAWQQLPRLKRYALQKADFVISISEYTRQLAVAANKLNEDRIHLLPNALEWKEEIGLESADFVQRSPGSKINLLSVCRLDSEERYKGVDKVIEALPDIINKVPDVSYTVVGGGTDLARHQQLARNLGVAERVHFLGFLSEEELRARYRDCDIFVMPSAGEGFGFVFLEAMKFGKPVVAANSGGAPEVVADFVTGRLVEYGNQPELATTLIELCLDPESRARLGAAGRQRLEERFRFENFRQKLTEIISQESPRTRYGLAQADESASCAS